MVAALTEPACGNRRAWASLRWFARPWLTLLGGHDGSGPGHPDVTYGRERPVPNTGRVVLRRDPGGWVPELWDAMPGGRRATHR